jgi:LPXTG-site transpeptidase (sortase) family protein
MIFKVLARFTELRLRYLKTGNLLVFAGLLMMAWGVINAFIQSQKGVNGWWNPLSAGERPQQSASLLEITPTPESYLIAVSQVIPTSDVPTISPTPLPSGMPTPTKIPFYRPDWIRIPIIKLEAPVVSVDSKEVKIGEDLFQQWLAPNQFAAGWHSSSAPLGVVGNTVLNGHNNIYGEVFRRLADLKFGDKIMVSSGSEVFVYRITNKMTFHELNQSIDDRLAHARWLMPSKDERLTLVTCWPYWSNEYRLVIVARPVDHYTETDPTKQ